MAILFTILVAIFVLAGRRGTTFVFVMPRAATAALVLFAALFIFILVTIGPILIIAGRFFIPIGTLFITVRRFV